MAKVIMLSRQFPKGHIEAGKPTYFVEKATRSLTSMGIAVAIQSEDKDPDPYFEFISKHHTIRAGKRWKNGDMASLRVWSDKAYRSPQITIAPDVKLTVKDIEIKSINTILIDGKMLDAYQMVYLAKNDGLQLKQLQSWFSKYPFSGQILIWGNAELPY